MIRINPSLRSVRLRALVRVVGVTVVCGIFILLLSQRKPAVATPLPADSRSDMIAFQPGEELEYEVTFLSLRLGTVRIKTDAQSTRDGRTVWHAFCYADSRSGIPFVSLHVVYESFIDELAGYSHGFISSDKQDDGRWIYTKYLFDYPHALVTIENGQGNSVWKKLDIHTPQKWCDGLALYFYARRNAMYHKTANVPTIVNEDTARTRIEFLGDRQSQEIDAVDYPIDCNHFRGTANWTGVYGLTGDFEGWFSNDAASIPIKARLKLLVGSAWLQLVHWSRPGWVPPKVH